jgi:DNA-binding SARP family transcriptional activator
VCGAPGIGKTTALRQVAASLDAPVAWLTLSDWHREPGRLLDDLLEALGAGLPGIRETLRGARPRSGEVVAVARELGAAINHLDGVVLVLDDCHVVADAAESRAVIGALVGVGRPGLRIALLGRTPLALQGVGVEVLHPEAYVGHELLDADVDEAREILHAHGSTADPAEAIAATGGWVAGLVFESWRMRSEARDDVDPLALYFEAEMRPQLDATTFELLVKTSPFETVTAPRAAALGYDGALDLFRSLRRGAVPATWSDDGAIMRLHPRIRQILADELRSWPRERVAGVLEVAGGVYEREGLEERAVDLYLQAGATEALRRLLPGVIVRIVERGDLELADRLLGGGWEAAVEPRIVLARLMLDAARQTTGGGIVLLDHVGRELLSSLVEAEPRIAPYACAFLAAQMRIDDAVRVLEATPRGRPHAVARLFLSAVRDDPDAPIPAFVGDGLDTIVARALWSRGRLLELHDERLARTAGLPEPVRSLSSTPEAGGLGVLLGRVVAAVDARDLGAAREAIAAIAERPALPWAMLAEAEVGVRVARDPALASSAVERLRAMRAWGVSFFRELGQVWEGGGLLLASHDESAARVLREAVDSMRRGDRTLELTTALVYLSEVEWRLGDEDAADRAADEAYAVARQQGSLRRLLLSLADFPGVLSRRLDAEPSADSEWHGLGRALALGASSAPGAGRPAVTRLREYGAPALVSEGVVVRPKIRKSLELLSFLASRPGSTVTRAEVLTGLWNGRDDDSTRAYLRQALRHLRDALPAGIAVTSHDDRLRIEGGVSTESGEVAALLAEAARHLGERRHALLFDAYAIVSRGLFLDGSDDVAWVDDCRARQRSTLADVRLDLADHLIGAERYLDALSYVDEALADDPILERGWRLRMQALAMLGDSDGVLVAFRRCRAALAELDLEPSRATMDLVRALRS